MNPVVRRLAAVALIGVTLGISEGLCAKAHAHGAHGGATQDEEREAGEFRAIPVLTIEGHTGFENNLEGQPYHSAIDLQFGGVFEWGLGENSNFTIEGQLGPAVVYGEAEHFYGRVEIEEEGAEEEEEDGSPFRRVDAKGYLAARYQPTSKLSISADWKPYWVSATQAEDVRGFKHEIGTEVVYAFGDGDVNFALGDGLESVVDGLFVSAENRTGWESDGTYLGNYTDTWVGFGFNYDQLNVTISGGPRFYIPGSYSGLDQRTDWGGEIELEYPLNEKLTLFAHWEPVYSTDEREAGGWGKGFQHHVGLGLTVAY